MWNLNKRNFGFIFGYNLFFRCVLSGINCLTSNNLYWLLRLTFLTETNYPKINVKLIEHEKMAKNAIEVGIGSFHWNRTYSMAAERSTAFLKKIICSFEHKNKVCLDHWVPLFLHLILLFCGNISSKLHTFGTQQTVWVGKRIHENKHNLAIVWFFLCYFTEIGTC